MPSKRLNARCQLGLFDRHDVGPAIACQEPQQRYAMHAAPMVTTRRLME